MELKKNIIKERQNIVYSFLNKEVLKNKSIYIIDENGKQRNITNLFFIGEEGC